MYQNDGGDVVKKRVNQAYQISDVSTFHACVTASLVGFLLRNSKDLLRNNNSVCM